VQILQGLVNGLDQHNDWGGLEYVMKIKRCIEECPFFFNITQQKGIYIISKRYFKVMFKIPKARY
jgi:hypothetical protein